MANERKWVFLWISAIAISRIMEVLLLFFFFCFFARVDICLLSPVFDNLRAYYCWEYREKTVKRRVCCTSIQILLHMPDLPDSFVFWLRRSQFPTWCRSSSRMEPTCHPYTLHTPTHDIHSSIFATSYMLPEWQPTKIAGIRIQSSTFFFSRSIFVFVRTIYGN